MNKFLPHNYKEPSSNSRYFKLVEGENKVRILSAPIIGWVDWHGNKAVRYEFENKPAQWFDSTKPGKHFWAVVAYSYDRNAICIWEIVQAKIRKDIDGLLQDQEWGEPYFYDLKINKTGSGKDTKYMVKPLPHKPISPAIKELFFHNRCKLDALLTGEDPWAIQFADESELTRGIFGKEDLMLPASSEKEEDDEAIPF